MGARVLAWKSVIAASWAAIELAEACGAVGASLRWEEPAKSLPRSVQHSCRALARPNRAPGGLRQSFRGRMLGGRVVAEGCSVPELSRRMLGARAVTGCLRYCCQSRAARRDWRGK